MPESARETRSAIATITAPITTSTAPPKPLVDQSATPPAIRSAAGRIPSRRTAPPIATLPVSCCPQRERNKLAERFRVSIGPVPSIAITGTARNVISDHPMSSSRATI